MIPLREPIRWCIVAVALAAASACQPDAETPAPQTTPGAVPTSHPEAAEAPAPSPGAPGALAIGDVAPDFAFALASGAEGETSESHLSDFRGRKNVILAFYPKVFTGGCTAQLCGYRDDYEMIAGLEAEVIAVSMDPQSESDRFREHHAMPFHVVGDPDGAIVNAYGVPRLDRQSRDGDFQIAQRSVFLVDKEGVVRFIDMNYDVQLGVVALYDAIEQLPGGTRGPGAGGMDAGYGVKVDFDGSADAPKMNPGAMQEE